MLSRERGDAVELQHKAIRAEKLGNPLAEAVIQRDRNVVDLVEQSIAQDHVLLAFQPIVHDGDLSSVVFHESLLRVLDQTGRVIPARDFLPSISSTDLARRLDCIALSLCLSELRKHPNLRLSVNTSARSLGYRKWVETLELGIDQTPHVANRLIIEISEPSVMQLPELVSDFMYDWQPKGVAFALDDYGAGPTSFMFFKDFFFDAVKLGESFSKDITQSNENQALVRGIASICADLETRLVATRVAATEDVEALAELGVTLVQGYAIEPPKISPAWRATNAS